jgi:adenylate cyclase
VVGRLQHWAYRRLGSRYPVAVVAAQIQFGALVVVAGVGLLTLYTDMTSSQFWTILLVALALTFLESLASTRAARDLTRPARRWLEGDHRDVTTVAAWRATATLPGELLRRRALATVVWNVVPLCVFITVYLDLDANAFLAVFAAAGVVLLYGVVLRFLLVELSLRPVVEDIARELPDHARLGRAGVPIRWKLLAGLPLINIITGVAVAGLSGDGNAQIGDLGLDVLVAVGVAFTVSLELTLLLSRSILDPIDTLQRATERVGEADFSVRVPVVSGDETGQLSRAFNDAIAGLDERERLQEAFGAYVDPDVAERVLEEGTALEGEEVEVSILFLDIRDFTGFAERATPREVVEELNAFFEVVVPVITAHGGHANKFVGDGLLGLFGAPERHEDHADRAVAAALDISREVAERFEGRVRIGIGVNSGPVVAGTIGGGGKVEFTVIGDPVNTAARVEEVTRLTGDDVLITEATRRLLSRDFGRMERRPSAPLKGKTERVPLWAPCIAEHPGQAAPLREAAAE